MRRKCRILDANDQKANLSKIMSDSKHLNGNEQSMLHDVLNKYEFLSNGTLGTWKTKHVNKELQPGAKYYHDRPYLVPWAHGAVFCKEGERLCQLVSF